MYQVEAWSALRRARRDAGGGLRWRHVSGTVWALGFTSLFTDVSSEMVATVLPVYLVLYLGLTPFQFGIVDGLYHGVTALLRLASGVAVDRTGRSKEIALAGYGASALSRLGHARGRRLLAAHRRRRGVRPGRQGRPRRASRRAHLAEQPPRRPRHRVRRAQGPRQRRRHAGAARRARHPRRPAERLRRRLRRQLQRRARRPRRAAALRHQRRARRPERPRRPAAVTPLAAGRGRAVVEGNASPVRWRARGAAQRGVSSRASCASPACCASP